MKTPFIEILKTVFKKDLSRLQTEIESYSKEDNLWKVTDGISNSAGNLCLHLIGNLNTYIGAELGKTGYIRERDKEFLLKNIPREKLRSMIDETMEVVQKSLDTLTEEDLQKEYPRSILEVQPTTAHFLVHLTTHLTYHLGQINYHRRLLDG